MGKQRSRQQGLENQGLNQQGQQDQDTQPQEKQEDQLVGPQGEVSSGRQGQQQDQSHRNPARQKPNQ